MTDVEFRPVSVHNNDMVTFVMLHDHKIKPASCDWPHIKKLLKLLMLVGCRHLQSLIPCALFCLRAVLSRLLNSLFCFVQDKAFSLEHVLYQIIVIAIEYVSASFVVC